jgi:hypothetical protein
MNKAVKLFNKEVGVCSKAKKRTTVASGDNTIWLRTKCKITLFKTIMIARNSFTGHGDIVAADFENLTSLLKIYHHFVQATTSKPQILTLKTNLSAMVPCLFLPILQYGVWRST